MNTAKAIIGIAGLSLFVSACASEPNQPTEPTPTTAPGEAPLYLATSGRGIPDEYIVMLKPGAAAAVSAQAVGASRQFTYSVGNGGFSARLTTGQVAALRQDPGVAWIEQDRVFSAG